MTQPPQNIFSSAPFRNAASEYLEKGWDVLPLPFRQKEPPPKGFTGRIAKGKFPTPEQVEQWKQDPDYERGNICVRVGRSVVIDGAHMEVLGIDIDDYGDKNGWDTFVALEQAYGKFPDTWISSARSDCRSGIRWVLVPAGFEYRGQVGPSIEVVQHVHRYGVVYPSYNPDASAQYYWYPPGTVPNGRSFSPEIPAVEQLAVLSESWFAHIKKGALLTGAEAVDADSNSLQLRQWFESNLVDPNTMCRTMTRNVRKRIELIETSPDHHDPLVTGHMHLFLLGVEGHNGWRSAVVEMEKAWLSRLEREGLSGNATRSLWVAKAELLRSREGAMRKIKGRVDAGLLAVVSKDTCARKKNGELIEDRYTKGQVRLARFYGKFFAGKMIFVPNIGWFVWDGKRWKEDVKNVATQRVLLTIKKVIQLADQKYEDARNASTDALRDQLIEQADSLMSDVMKCQSSGAIDGILKIARTLPQIAVESSQLDSHPYLLNLADCTLDLKTGATHEHDPRNLITKVARGWLNPTVTFDADTHCPAWAQFLEQVLPDPEVRDYLCQIMGVSLVGLQLEHMLLILHGNGRNGKGVFERVMRHVLGDYGVSAASDLFTAGSSQHTTSQTDLMGKRLAVIDETESNARLSEALVKKLTGGGEHTARRMHQNNIRFPMTWLAMMITNHLPSIDGKGVAIWDRLVIVKFPRYFEPQEQNKQLDELLKAETNGILMWIYSGWKKYQDAGYQLTQPQSIKDAIAEYQDSQDDLGVWMKERLQFGEGELFRSKTDELLKDFNAWCMNNQIPAKGKHQFCDELRQKGFVYSRSWAWWSGIRLDPARGEFTVKAGK